MTTARFAALTAFPVQETACTGKLFIIWDYQQSPIALQRGTLAVMAITVIIM